MSLRALLPLIAATLGTAACASVGAVPTTPAPAVRVMTYNIQYGGGGRSLDDIIAVIRAADADIVGLQEVDVHWADRSGFADQASAIASATGMEVRFAPIYDLDASEAGRPRRQFGVAILSRLPIVEFRNRSITRLSTQDTNPTPRVQPGFAAAVIDVHGTALRVFNTHLDYRSDPSVRRQQVEEMLAIVGEVDSATVLMGDLNAPPEAAELAPLFRRLEDAWPASGGGGFTIPAKDPVRRIDYVLVSDGFEVRSARVPDTAASDHRPVVIDLVLRGGAQGRRQR